MLIYSKKYNEHKSHMPNAISYLPPTWILYLFLHTHMPLCALRMIHFSTLIHHIIGGGYFFFFFSKCDFTFRSNGKRFGLHLHVEVSLSIVKAAVVHIT